MNNKINLELKKSIDNYININPINNHEFLLKYKIINLPYLNKKILLLNPFKKSLINKYFNIEEKKKKF